jgi:hypothetical protein
MLKCPTYTGPSKNEDHLSYCYVLLLWSIPKTSTAADNVSIIHYCYCAIKW